MMFISWGLRPLAVNQPVGVSFQLSYLSCFQVKTIHLSIKTSKVYKVLRSRGVEQRNLGLSWIRDYCEDPGDKPECSRGVIYFMDDDNKYDMRLFQEVSNLELVGEENLEKKCRGFVWEVREMNYVGHCLSL